MKFIPAADGQELHTLELTRRNLEVLLAKLDDPLSQRTLRDPDWHVMVRAVENVEHYSDREPGEMYMPSTGERV